MCVSTKRALFTFTSISTVTFRPPPFPTGVLMTERCKDKEEKWFICVSSLLVNERATIMHEHEDSLALLSHYSTDRQVAVTRQDMLSANRDREEEE